MNLKEIEIYAHKIEHARATCECSRVVYFTKRRGIDNGFIICSYCGKKIYRNKKEEFKDKMMSELRKEDNNV